MKNLSAVSVLQKLEKVAIHLQAVVDVEGLGGFVLTAVDEIIPVDAACLYFYNAGTARLELTASKGFTEAELVAANTSVMERKPGEVFRKGETEQLTGKPENTTSLLHGKPAQSYLCLPVMGNAGCVGVLELTCVAPGCFTKVHIATLSFICRLIGAAYVHILSIQQKNNAEEMMMLHDRALMSSSNGIVITDALQADNPIIYVNKSFEKLTGYKQHEITGKNCRFLNSPRTNREALQKIREAIAKRQGVSTLLLNQRKDGSLFWNDLTITPLVNEEGVTTHFIGVQEDVTGRIEAGAKLRDASLRIAALIQNLQTGILVEDEERKIVLTNAEFCTMFGIPTAPEDMAGMDYTSLSEDFKSMFKDPQQFVTGIKTALSNKVIVRNLELELIDGRTFERDYIPIFMAKSYRGHLWQYRDITYRKQTERKIKQSEEHYRNIVNFASEVIFSITPDGIFTVVNPTSVRVMEYPEEQFIGMNYLSLVRPDYKECTYRFYQKQIREKIISTYFEFPAITKSGKEIWFGQNVHLLVEGDTVVGLQAVARDITEIKKYQDDIKSLKEFYEQILNDLPGQIAVFDTDLRYLFINPESLRDNKLRDWIIGRDDLDYCRRRGIDESVGKHRQFYLKQALKTGTAFPFEEKITYPDGTTRFFFRVISPVLDKQRNIVRLVGYGVDITERRQAEDERDRFFNLSPDLLCIAGFDKMFRRINPAFEKLLGYTSPVLISSPLTNFIHPDDIDATINEISRVRDGGIISDFENRFICKDGSIKWISWQATAFIEGDVLYAVGRDITQRKHVAEELLRAKGAAEESIRAKDRFLAHMSHEIRTPMNAVLGLSHLLLEMHPSPEQEHFLNAIKFSSENLLVIINDILDFSKIEAGKIDYAKEPFLFDELLNQVQQTVAFAKSDKNIDFIIEINPEVPNVLIGDQVRLNQIILNLVSNAVKFTREGNVTIHCRVWDRLQDTVTLMIQISDTGIGISKEDLSRIFERFEQVADNRTTKIRGTGLGLAIVKGLVENQGGSIVAESSPGKGSVFTILMPFLLPLEDVSVNQEYGVLPEPEITAESVQGFNVLIAEDNEMNQLVVTSMLKLWQVPYAIAQNGLEAFTMLRDGNYNLVLMDISMPELDGYEATAKIRAELLEPKKDTYIIALTASALLESKEMVLQSGMNDYLSKPFKPHELLSKLAKARMVISGLPEKAAAPGIKTSGQQQITHLAPLYEMVTGDLTTMREMITLFIGQTPEALAKLQGYYKAGDWRELVKIAHRLRPTMGYMGLHDAMDMLLEVEKSALEQRGTGKIGFTLDRVEAMVKQAISELIPELEKMKKF